MGWKGSHPGGVGKGVEMTADSPLGTSSADRSRDRQWQVEGNVGSGGTWARMGNARAES